MEWSRPPFQRRSGHGRPGGWWIATEVEALLTWRTAMSCDPTCWAGSASAAPSVRPARRCEIGSASDSTLTVMRRSHDGYIAVLRAERHEVVRPEPFDAIEIAVGTLFGDDPPGG